MGNHGGQKDVAHFFSGERKELLILKKKKELEILYAVIKLSGIKRK